MGIRAYRLMKLCIAIHFELFGCEFQTQTSLKIKKKTVKNLNYPRCYRGHKVQFMLEKLVLNSSMYFIHI